jgi:hypothetical protein
MHRQENVGKDIPNYDECNQKEKQWEKLPKRREINGQGTN